MSSSFAGRASSMIATTADSSFKQIDCCSHTLSNLTLRRFNIRSLELDARRNLILHDRARTPRQCSSFLLLHARHLVELRRQR